MALKKEQQSLKKWSDQKWRTSSGKPSEGKLRYLPNKAWDALTPGEKAATNKAKKKGNERGDQFVSQPKNIADKTAKYRINEEIFKVKFAVETEDGKDEGTVEAQTEDQAIKMAIEKYNIDVENILHLKRQSDNTLNEKLTMPKKNEEKDDFISRFMGSELAMKEFPDNKQRVAVAFSQWDRSKKLSEEYFQSDENIAKDKADQAKKELQASKLNSQIEQIKNRMQNQINNLQKRKMQITGQEERDQESNNFSEVTTDPTQKATMSNMNEAKLLYRFKGPIKNSGVEHSGQDESIHAHSDNQAIMLLQRRMAKKYPGANIWMDKKYLSREEKPVEQPKAEAKPEVKDPADNDELYTFDKKGQMRFKLEESQNILAKHGVEGYNKPKRTPGHKTKSHIVVAKKGDKIKVVRFGAQGVSGSPKKDGESESYRKRRQGFVARHKAQNPGGMKDKFSALYWANKVKW
jgi:1,2-phenylacetyl-CoA epoxidase PaaB subunit